MALNIKRPETERLVRMLAQRTGESVTLAVERAVRERLDRTESADVQQRYAELRAIVDSIGPVPKHPTREEIDEEMYDEWGLPR